MRALVVGIPADIVFAVTNLTLFAKADPNKEMDVNWKPLVDILGVLAVLAVVALSIISNRGGANWQSLLALIGAVAVIAVVVLTIQGPEHVRQAGHFLWVRWLRGIGGSVMLFVALWALVARGVSGTVNVTMLIGAMACVLIGAYLVRLGLSPS